MKLWDRILGPINDVCQRTKEGRWLKSYVKDFFSYPVCPHCRRWDMAMDLARVGYLIGLLIVGQGLIAMTEGDIESQCCKAYQQIAGQFNSGVAFINPENIKSIDYREIALEGKVVMNMNSTTFQPTTTTLQTCPEPIICPNITKIVWPNITCPPRFTPAENSWMLNYKPDQGAACYQNGGFDVKDDWLEYLQVEGRPKFKSRGSKSADMNQYTGYKKESDATFCFKDLGNYFILNRTPTQYNQTRWGWNDDGCKNSWLRVNRL